MAFVVAAMASVTDVRTGRIPNTLTLGAIGLALALRALGLGRNALTPGLAGLAGLGTIMVALYFTAGIGGGDVKLLMALGAIEGLTIGLHVLFWLLVVSVLVAIVRLGPAATWAITLRTWLLWAALGARGVRGPAADTTSHPVPVAPMVLASLAAALAERSMGFPLGGVIEWGGAVL